MNEHDIVKEWLKIAYEDYDTAKYLYDHKYPKPLEIICYHCQQSAEKSLKAYICANNIEVTKTHEVGLLCRQCSELDGSFIAFLDDCERLEFFATQTRYPNRIQIEEPNTEKSLQQALKIYEFVSEKIQQLFMSNEAHNALSS